MEDMSKEELETKKKMIEMGTWYAPLTIETLFSKYFSMILFAFLPFVGFWLGVGYESGKKVGDNLFAQEQDMQADIVNEQKEDTNKRLSEDWTWEDFASEKWGFDVTYPSYLIPSEHEHGIVFYRTISKDKKEIKITEVSIGIDFYRNKNEQDIESWYLNTVSKFAQKYERRIIDGQVVIASVSNPDIYLGDIVEYEIYYIPVGKHIVYVTVPCQYSEQSDDYMRIVESLKVDSKSILIPDIEELQLIKYPYGKIVEIVEEEGQRLIVIREQHFFNTSWSRYVGDSINGYIWGQESANIITLPVADEVDEWLNCGQISSLEEMDRASAYAKATGEEYFDALGVESGCARKWDRESGGSYWLVQSEEGVITDLIIQYVP